jgi:hypothetical protein
LVQLVEKEEDSDWVVGLALLRGATRIYLAGGLLDSGLRATVFGGLL